MIIMNPNLDQPLAAPGSDPIIDPGVKEEIEEEEEGSLSSPPLLPIRPTPTSLFQPFLSWPSAKENHLDKPLTFSIDNILRPTFGGRMGTALATPHSAFFATPILHSSFMAAAAFAAAAAAVAASSGITPPQATPPSLATPLSPTLSTTSSTSSCPPAPVKKEPKAVDLSSAASTASTASDRTSEPQVDASELPNGVKKDDDCPPGMVRGPNGQLWPAWVFCTRYSDRPSSGKFFHPLSSDDALE